MHDSGVYVHNASYIVCIAVYRVCSVPSGYHMCVWRLTARSWCNWRQDMEGKEREKTERLRFGRFWYRFPHGESGADVYDRMTIFEDHMIRDINAGRFSNNTSLVLVTHGLALRIFLMRYAHSPRAG